MSDVLIIAAEPSSALYAQRLLELWKTQSQSVRAFGVGSREMEKLGFECLGYAEEMAVVGIQEILPKFKEIAKVFKSIVKKCEEKKPKCAILMDYPGFNLRMAKKLKSMGIPVVYYISPQVWAWKPGRVKVIKKYVDDMLVLFEFEKEFFDKHGVRSEFVGHPLLDEIEPSLFDANRISDERGRFGLSAGKKVLGLMPGSRRSELKYHLMDQIRAAAILKKEIPHLAVTILVAPNFEIADIQKYIEESPVPLSFIKRPPFEMISLCDVIACASGTATLMVGMMSKPMVIMYRAHALTVGFLRMIVKRPECFGLSNIILGRQLSQELMQEEITPESIADHLRPLLTDATVYEAHRSALSTITHKLGNKGATVRVAKYLEKYLA